MTTVEGLMRGIVVIEKGRLLRLEKNSTDLHFRVIERSRTPSYEFETIQRFVNLNVKGDVSCWKKVRNESKK